MIFGDDRLLPPWYEQLPAPGRELRREYQLKLAAMFIDEVLAERLGQCALVQLDHVDLEDKGDGCIMHWRAMLDTPQGRHSVVMTIYQENSLTDWKVATFEAVRL